MKTILLLIILMPSLNTRIISQCNFIPSTSKATDTLTYKFSGGIFDSQGCVLIDPTYWLAGSEATVKVTFVNPESYPSIRVWGMNDDDTASVSINGVGYPLTYSSASYDKKVICGLSPGPDGVIFSNGKLVGANNNKIGNYSYQNIQLNLKNVSTITLSGL